MEEELFVGEKIPNFVRALNNGQQFLFRNDMIYFLEKPYKWKEEFELWKEYGEPIGSEEEGWWDFLDSLKEVK